ncbi:MAG: phosphoribosyltransferase, partial [Oscillospiraceae bacterium]
MTSIKSMHLMAKNAAKELASNYTSTPIDTIVCLDGTEIIGAFLANELCKTSLAGMNSNQDIAVLTPEVNSSNQMLFRDNVQKMIWEKNILLLVASVSTGKTINRALDCVHYYGGKIGGICALFSVIDEVHGTEINRIFGNDDVPDYKNFSGSACPFCKEGRKIDAIVNSYGYSKL